MLACVAAHQKQASKAKQQQQQTQIKVRGISTYFRAMNMKHSDERHMNNVMMSGINPLFRTESFGHYNTYPDEQREKRQLYLRSYQFCRKKNLSDRIKGSLVRVKKEEILSSSQ
ncbi:hypothetical protein AHAS_Ahas16G0082100 [Arachis hypogaea]